LIAAALALAACDAVVGPRVGEVQSTAMNQGLAPASLPAFFDCLRERSQTAISAHRGGWQRGRPENALSTFEHAIAQTPVFLEIDVQAARDGLAIMHDDTVNRTTNGHGALADLTLAEVQALQLKDESGRLLDEHPLSLRDALDWAERKTVLELDIKRGVRYEEVIEEVEAARAMDRVVFIVPNVSAAVRLARLAPDAMMYVTIDDAADLDELERRHVDLAHVVAWTGDEEPNSALNIALAQRGVEARFGMFGRAGQAAAYADTGLQIIATDVPGGAVMSLDQNDGVEGGYGALQCVSAR
jgi:glycerophosphoryl diester phosphodiesterase